MTRLKTLLSRRYAPQSLLALAGITAILLALLPPEATLGSIIRIVLLHGALARAGLVAFAVAALLGAVLLARPTPQLESWTLASQTTAFTVWFLGALTSAIATYQSWGVLIAWGEPRTQATAMILALAVVMLGVVRWLRNARFTGLSNMVVGVFAWTLVSRASSIQHPQDPVGTSPSTMYQVIFLALVGTLVVASVQFARWIRRLDSEERPRPNIASEST
ncbi:MAG: hypothetical protein KJO98_10970 [Rhodothermia bacterium]|nr:hypothetical protein [Rhodothermia bacterium]